MNPSEAPSMVIPSGWTSAVFVAIVLCLAVGLVAAVRYTGVARGDARGVVRRHVWLTSLAVVAYLALTAAVAASGVLRRDGVPPPMMAFFVGTNLVAIVAAFSALGTRLSRGLPIVALAGFQVFRLPLELVLHQWWAEGTLPVQMTYVGDNFDIISGILGGVIGLWAWRSEVPKTALWVFNVVGFALLLRVMSIAVLSSPIPIRQYLGDPPVLLAMHVPYVWIVPICVGGALLGHLLLFRRLLAR